MRNKSDVIAIKIPIFVNVMALVAVALANPLTSLTLTQKTFAVIKSRISSILTASSLAILEKNEPRSPITFRKTSFSKSLTRKIIVNTSLELTIAIGISKSVVLGISKT